MGKNLQRFPRINIGVARPPHFNFPARFRRRLHTAPAEKPDARVRSLQEVCVHV